VNLTVHRAGVLDASVAVVGAFVHLVTGVRLFCGRNVTGLRGLTEHRGWFSRGRFGGGRTRRMAGIERA